MARTHSGGFVERDFYWNIGQADRGRDGMNAREAAQRYNDHRHPAIELTTPQEVVAWINETESASNFVDGDAIQGGTITSSTDTIRKPGDMMRYQGIVWVYVSNAEVYPVGVGEGCHIDVNGNFHREARYASIPLVSARVSDVTDEQGQGVDPSNLRGEQVTGFLIEPYKYTASRARPYMYIRVAARLTPSDATVDETNADVQAILDLFPRKARVMIFTRDVADLANEDGVYDISGGLVPMPVYSDQGAVLNDDSSSTIGLQQSRDDRLSVVSSNPLALELSADAEYYMLINVDTHVYTDAEVAGTAYTAAQVNNVTRCSLEIESLTLEVESYLGLAPYIDNNSSVRYTAWERP